MSDKADTEITRDAVALGQKAAQTGHVLLAVVTLLMAAKTEDAYKSVPTESVDEVAEILYEAGW